MSNLQRIEILTTRDKEAWRAALDEIGTYSFYHMPEFHRLAEIRGEGEGIMPVYREDGFIAAFPMLLRDIQIHGQSTGMRDATSVAGFAGPIASMAEPPKDIVRRVQSALHEFLHETGVVSVFSRMNPVASRPRLLDGMGVCVERGNSLVIDLTAPLDVQLARYKSERRKKLRRLEETDLTIDFGGMEHIDDFVRIFSQTMDRTSADHSYRFDRFYIEYLLREMPDVMHIGVCKLDGEVISVVLDGFCGGIVEGYIGGTSTEHRQMSPSTILYDRIRVWGTSIGAKSLHVGGGVGGLKDTVYSYKLSFGANEMPYYTWRYVVDQPAYDKLCREAGGTPTDDIHSEYFPNYRDPELGARETVGV